jgi:hypothetical protein
MPGDILADLVAQGVVEQRMDLGDPGTTIDGDTARADLPPYDGPPQPSADHVHEWGASIADEPDSAPDLPPTVPYPGAG